MKERITYVVTQPEPFRPEQISVEKGKNGDRDAFHIKGVNAAKEHRITLGLDELSSDSIINMYLLLEPKTFHNS